MFRSDVALTFKFSIICETSVLFVCRRLIDSFTIGPKKCLVSPIYNKHYNQAFEQKRIRRKNQRKNPKPWILPWLENACARKNTAFYENISNPSPENKAKYVKLKIFTEKHIALAKKRFYLDYFEKHQTDSNKQWE